MHSCLITGGRGPGDVGGESQRESPWLESDFGMCEADDLCLAVRVRHFAFASRHRERQRKGRRMLAL